MDEKWSTRMARLEALLTIGHHPFPSNATLPPVKVPAQHGPRAGALSQAPLLLSTVSSGQTAPASGPDGALTSASATTSVGMTSPLENLYPDIDSSEPVFSQPGPVATSELVSHPHPVSATDPALETYEEGELSEVEDQPELDTGESYRAISEDQNYRETVRGVHAFMGWTHIPDLEYYPASRTDNPWVGHRSQPVGKVSVLLPSED